MDTIFIQFYSSLTKTRDEGRVLIIYNGFSDTYDLCKSKGDFYWVNLDGEKSKKLPIKKGTAYVSAVHMEHLSQVYKWALQYPNIKFIVGGPAIQTESLIYKNENPPNVEKTKKSVEEYFGVTDYSGKYKINLSGIKDKFKKGTMLCTYTLNPSCYWGKCKFCAYYFYKSNPRKDLDFSFIDDIDFDGRIQIRLNMPSITPEYIVKLFNSFQRRDNKIIYDLLLRCDNSIYKSLKKNLEKKSDLPRLKIRLGVEFMSDRILKFLNKGFKTKDVYKMLDLLYDHGDKVQTYLNFMTGIPDINKYDVESVRKYVQSAKNVSSVNILRMICFLNTELHEMYKHRQHQQVVDNGVYGGYYISLPDEDLLLNMEVEELLKQLPCDWLYYNEPLEGSL